MIKNPTARKTIAIFLLLNFLSTLAPYNALYANNNGPNAPEASGFEPVSATDMVNLSSGDMAYVLPLLEIDGFPVTLSYHAGIPMDMEASWVGLGWNINTGAISRGVVSTPDDWNMGKSMKFTYYYYETESYTVNVGVGLSQAAEVGVGLSWGSNKSLSGSVFATAYGVTASIDTDGNYSVGLSSSMFTGQDSPFGGGLSVSGNVNKGGLSVGATAGYSKGGLNAGLGISVSENGIGAGFSIGGSSETSGGTKMSAGGGGSIGSFSLADMSISSSGFYIPLQIYIFTFGFGYQKQKISYAKGLNRYGFGSLYQTQGINDIFNNTHGELRDNSSYNSNVYDYTFNDIQRRNYYGDTYDQELPQTEVEFIKDYKTAVDKINFTFAGYDSYGVNASGISGGLSPILGHNTVLIGEGFEGDDTDNGSKKMKVFYHNSTSSSNSNSLRTNKKLQNYDLHFSFKGQVNNDVNISGSISDNSGSKTSGLNLSDFARKTSNYTSYSGRPKTRSYVEVYTNNQLDANKSLMLLPTSVYKSTNKNRTNLGYHGDGIGGYKITTADGKIYHFAQPVYQYEEIEHNYIEIEEGQNISKLNSSAKRSATPYATHWLLTAITGPDFIDKNNNNYPDEEDYGYWLRLEHGQWSNAYVWRTPYAGTELDDISIDNSITVPKEYRRYNTYNEDNIDKVDAGQFRQGRKDLYYLDKIVSRQQTAYFVKDLRKDGYGTDLNYSFTKELDNNDKIAQAKSTMNNETIRPYENAKYSREYLLRLDRIIIEKNSDENGIQSEQGGTSIGHISNTVMNSPYSYNRGTTFFSMNLPSANQTHKQHQALNVIDLNDFSNYDYSKALKVIKFNNNNYDLAKQSPNSEATTKGRLTLKEVKFYGRGMFEGATESDLYDYMPPYRFDYQRPDDVIFNRNDSPSTMGEEKDLTKKDSWGFIEGTENGSPNGKTLADSWSLNKIITPQGSTIDIDYEEDDYYIEAFSRRYWEKNLMFRVYEEDDQYYRVEIINDKGLLPNINANFSDYFKEGDKVFMDMWLCRHWNSGPHVRTKFNVTGEDFCKVKRIIDFEDNSKDELHLLVKKRNGMFSSDRGIHVLSEGYYTNRQSNSNASHIYKNLPRGECPGDVGYNADHWSMKYKLLATKSPKGNSGGGLKVTKITVNDAAGAKYETTYDYHVPDPITGELTDKSSGITSFYPIYGTTFVPYQNELPGPGVMYEWVTMQAKGYDATGRELPSESTRYHYYTLQPNFHIFDPNFEMKDNDGDVLFKATVTDKTINKADITAKDIHIEKNLGKVGQLISIEQFNSEGHLLNKIVNEYSDKSNTHKETFTSMKSIYTYNFNDEGEYTNRKVKDRLLSLSSVSETGKVLSKVTSISPSGVSSIEYSDPDPWLGNYRSSLKTKADGTKVKETKYPAYERYTEMGSKILNPAYKNMLTQEAMNVTSVQLPGTNIYKTTNASVITWNNEWSYIDEDGYEPSSTTEVPVWRKHKTFAWKGDVDEYGTYGREVKPNDFRWGVGDTQTNEEWEEISEITHYTHYSLPVETKDINGNFASSKMAENFSKIIASGNAKYTEMYYSGAEYPDAVNVTKTEDEFIFENCTISNVAHTGDNSISLTSGSKAFKLNKSVGENNEIRSGKYKVSFWVHNGLKLKNSVKLVLNGVEQVPNEIIPANNWSLFNYYVSVNGSSLDMYIEEDYSGSFYIDDFRIHPISSSINSYVYDKDTDELRYVLDANNLATEFKYDKAGRLCRTFKEVVDESINKGGFKLVKEYRYRYQNSPSYSGECGCCEGLPQ